MRDTYVRLSILLLTPPCLTLCVLSVSLSVSISVSIVVSVSSSVSPSSLPHPLRFHPCLYPSPSPSPLQLKQGPALRSEHIASSESRKKEPQQHWSFAQKHENTDLREIIEAESKTDLKAFGMLMIAWILVVICSLAKTSLTCGSTWFYGLCRRRSFLDG